MPDRRSSAPSALPALGITLGLLLWGGCKTPVQTVVPGADGRLTLHLVHPDCSYCDPFGAVDTLRIDVYDGAETLLTSASFHYPDESPLLPDLDGFGVVRIEIAGLSAGKVESGGRTPLIALEPGVATTVDVLFAPVNKTLPLSASMIAQRSRHVAFRRHDGRVVLMGGVDGGRDDAFASIEVYDPATMSFAADAAVLPVALAAPATAWTAEETLLLVGGTATAASVDTVVATTGLYLPDSSALVQQGDLSVARAGGCLARFGAHSVVAFGGGAGGDLGVYAAGAWNWTGFSPIDFDPAGTLACVPLADGSVFVLGPSVSATGVWDFADDGTGDPAASFHPADAYTVGDPRYVSGALVVPLEDGRVWIAGGADISSGSVTGDGRIYSASSGAFSPAVGLQGARYDGGWDRWYRDGWYVVGCGWQDVTRVRDEQTVELVAPATGEAGPSIPIDRGRSGCSVTTLVDGAVLLAGGFNSTSSDDAGAAVIIPWLDEVLPEDTGGSDTGS